MAVLPGASTFTMSFTSGKFDSSMFSMANAIKDVPEANTDHAWRTNGSYVMSTGERVTPDATSHQVTLLHPAINNSVYISGMVETGENVVATGYFKVTTADGVTTVTFSADDSYLENVEIVYDYVQEVHEAVVTNMESAIGECVAIWPVYGSADDCSESDIIGYYIVKVFRARITQVPGMDTSLNTLRDAA